MPEQDLPFCQADVTINAPRVNREITGYILCAQVGCEKIEIDFKGGDAQKKDPGTLRMRSELTRAQFAGAVLLLKECPRIDTCPITERIPWNQMPVELRPKKVDTHVVRTNVF